MNYPISRRTLIASLSLLSLSSLNAFAQDAKLTILHTNDTHGHLLPFSYPSYNDPTSMTSLLKQKKNIGGAARRATMIKKIKAETKNPVIAVDAGDIMDGTPFSTEYHGDADIAAMNAIGYDVACLGNHEFSNTFVQMKKLTRDAKFPILSGNETLKTDGSDAFLPGFIKEIGGVKYGFFGLVTYDARTYTGAKNDLNMTRPMEAARKIIPELRKQCDILIAVTHIGVEEDIQLAAEFPQIDVIVGGHSHTLLPQPILLPRPLDLRPNSIHGAVIVQDHQWGGTLGRLDLSFHKQPDGSWTVSSYKGNLIPVTSSTPEDPATAAVVDKYWKPIEGKYGQTIGVASDDFVEKGDDMAQYNLVCDAMKEMLPEVDFDVENMGGVRSLLVKGPITYGDMVNLDPFGNTIVTFTITGKQLKELLRRNTPAVSYNLHYTVRKGDLVDAKIGGAPIDDAKVYKGATNNYYAPFILKEASDVKVSTRPRLETTIEYIRKHTPVQPKYDGRRVVVK